MPHRLGQIDRNEPAAVREVSLFSTPTARPRTQKGRGLVRMGQSMDLTSQENEPFLPDRNSRRELSKGGTLLG